jgi:hypothetical protein
MTHDHRTSDDTRYDTHHDAQYDGRHDTRYVETDHVAPETRGEIVAREREHHGGVKIGASFFGWLAATGMAVLLTAIVAATGVLTGEATGNDTPSEAVDATGLQIDELSVLGIIAALAIWFVAYYCGGYVAGRMARFDGIKQGIAVWVWALVVAIVIAVLAAVAGDEYTVSDGLPNIDGEPSTTVIIGVVVVALVSLVGAMLGGLAGMRFHRRVDRTGLGR